VAREDSWYPPAYEADRVPFRKLKDKVNKIRGNQGKQGKRNQAELIHLLIKYANAEELASYD